MHTSPRQRVMPLSLQSYRRTRYSQMRHEQQADAHLDAVFTGFCYGLAAAALAWLILSGTAVRLLVGLGRVLVGAGS